MLNLGVEKNHIAEDIEDLVSSAFVLLATLGTFAMTNSDGLTRMMISGLKRLGVRDLEGFDPARQAKG